MIESLIKKLIYKLGFSISKTQNESYGRGITILRIPKEALAVFSQLDNPFYIEFIGVPGVGKSTLLNKLPKTKKWMGSIEFLKRNGLKLSNSANLDNELVHQYLARLKLQSIMANNFTPLDKLRVLKYLDSVLRRDILISSNNKNSTIIADEGLFHNFSDSILDFLKEEKDEHFKELIKGRAIIYCYSTPEIVAKQIIKRKKSEGIVLPQHKTESFEELVALQKLALMNKEIFINTIKEYNIPVLSLNTAHNSKENIREINQFLDQLQNLEQN